MVRFLTYLENGPFKNGDCGLHCIDTLSNALQLTIKSRHTSKVMTGPLTQVPADTHLKAMYCMIARILKLQS